MKLSLNETKRYQKQLILPEVGRLGQIRLKNSTVLVVGAGGLGCPVLTYLVAAGIGHIQIIDADKVGISNLHRQTLYTTEDIGKPKVFAAQKRLLALNPEVEITVFDAYLNPINAQERIQSVDMVVDCTDNFDARYLINDTCVACEKPFVYGAIHQFEGQVSVFNHCAEKGERGPTYRCLFPEKPNQDMAPSCNTTGVMGLLPGLVGMYQANEVIKMILNIGEILSGKLLLVDILTNKTHIIRFKRKP